MNPEVTLYRAAKDDYVDEGYAFSTSRKAAEAYLDNPGFGGSRLFKTRLALEPERVADLRGRGAGEVAKKLGLKDPGAVTTDVYVTHLANGHVRRALMREGFEWVIVDETYPEGTDTWVRLGQGDDPELVEIKSRG